MPPGGLAIPTVVGAATIPKRIIVSQRTVQRRACNRPSFKTTSTTCWPDVHPPATRTMFLVRSIRRRQRRHRRKQDPILPIARQATGNPVHFPPLETSSTIFCRETKELGIPILSPVGRQGPREGHRLFRRHRWDWGRRITVVAAVHDEAVAAKRVFPPPLGIATTICWREPHRPTTRTLFLPRRRQQQQQHRYRPSRVGHRRNLFQVRLLPMVFGFLLPKPWSFRMMVTTPVSPWWRPSASETRTRPRNSSHTIFPTRAFPL